MNGPRALRLLLLTALAACAPRHEPAPRLNVLLVSIDTLRADHVGSYGYERDTTPRLDAFAARATRYANALAPAPWTLPSHAAMLTGRHPHEIGVTNDLSRIPERVATLAEELSRSGFQTAAFVDSGPQGFVGGERGFDRGFDLFQHAPHTPDWTYKYDMALTARAAEDWLTRRDPERPFFLFLHTKSVHSLGASRDLDGDAEAPYHTPAPYRRRFLEDEGLRFRWVDEPSGVMGTQYLVRLNRRFADGRDEPAAFPVEKRDELIALYDGGITYADEHIGSVLDTLDRLGLRDETLVIVTSDHGEGFLEHGAFLHTQLYGMTLRVPLLLFDPQDERRGVVDTPVSLIDVTPTILTRLGLDAPRGTTGTPLPRPGGRRAARTPLFSSLAPDDEEPDACSSAAVHAGPWKLVYHRSRCDEPVEPELYRWLDDPLDGDAVHGEGRVRSQLLEAIERWLGSRSRGEPASRLELEDETREDLRALGYGG